MTTVNITTPATLKPPFVCVVKATVDYTGGNSTFDAQWSIDSGHSNSRVVGLNGLWVTDWDYTLHRHDAAQTEVFAAVWVWGTSFPNTTIRCTIDGVHNTGVVSVQADARSFNLVSPHVIVNGQTELDALIAGGGTTDQVYLRGGFYQKIKNNVDNLQKMETHPDDWFAGLPAVLQGDGTYGAGSDSHRIEVNTRDNFILRRLFFYRTFWSTFYFQDVANPTADNIIQWEVTLNNAFDGTTGGRMADVHTIGAWDPLDDGENADGIVISNTDAGSDNRVTRCIGMACSDDTFDGWRSHDTTWSHVFAGFAGNGGSGDGRGLKLNGSAPAGSNLVRNSYFYDCDISVTSNSQSPDSISYYHNLTVVNSRSRDYFWDGTGVAALYDVRNCISLTNNNGQNWGLYTGFNNSWQLGITPDIQETIEPFHISWEGFEAMGFGRPTAVSPTINAGTNDGLDSDTVIVSGTVDVGAAEYGAPLYTEPTVPVGLTVEDVTPTDVFVKYLKPGVDNDAIVPVGGTSWTLNQTLYNGYSGSGYAVSSGSAAAGQDGAALPFPIHDVPLGVYAVYIRIYAPSGSSDSVYSQKNTDAGAYHSDNATQYGQFYWLKSLIALDGQEAFLNIRVRDSGVGIDGVVIVEASETELPTGELGYTTTWTPPAAPDPTAIAGYFQSLKAGVDNYAILANGPSTWLADQTNYEGFTGTGHALSQGGVSDGQDGGVMSFDVSSLAAGTYDIWAYIYALTGVNDSFYVQKNTDALGYYSIIATQHTEWHWVKASLTLDGTETTLNAVVREAGLALDQLMIVAGGTVAPTGPVGYEDINGPANNPPVITSPSAYDAVVGQPFTLAPTTSDADGDTVTITFTQLPGWLVDNTDGTATGTPASGDIGTNNAEFTASDGTDTTAPFPVTIEVTAAPVMKAYHVMKNGKRYYVMESDVKHVVYH